MKDGTFMKTFFRTAIILIILLPALSCSGERSTWLDNLTAAEKKEYKTDQIPEQRIDELKQGIKEYEAEVARTVKAAKQIGIYYRMLALEYMSLEMYNEALNSLEQAVKYFPTSPMLYYYAAISAGQMKEAVFSKQEADSYIAEAEKMYLRAVNLDPGYKEALYGLSVLYVFELERPLDAEPLLERLVSMEQKNFNAMFLLARVKVVKGDYDSAVDIYMDIESRTADEEVKAKAADNIRQLSGGRG